MNSEEILDTAKLHGIEKPMNFDEAPASANVRVKTKRGYQWQFTMRTSTVAQLIKQIEVAEDLFEDKGWVVPEWQSESKPIVKSEIPNGATKNCPIHNEIMTERMSKKTGKPYFAHSSGSGPGAGLCFGTPPRE